MKIILLLVLTSSIQVFAGEPGSKIGRSPSKEGQLCITFKGEGAKKTFMTLYPFTQGKVTAIIAEETRTGETVISTSSIFCRVFTTGLSRTTARTTLERLTEDKFLCGYFISSEGGLTPCSDPM